MDKDSVEGILIAESYLYTMAASSSQTTYQR